MQITAVDSDAVFLTHNGASCFEDYIQVNAALKHYFLTSDTQHSTCVVCGNNLNKRSFVSKNLPPEKEKWGGFSVLICVSTASYLQDKDNHLLLPGWLARCKITCAP
jgi:hypothetical protein